jgi:hypothetical protein
MYSEARKVAICLTDRTEWIKGKLCSAEMGKQRDKSERICVDSSTRHSGNWILLCAIVWYLPEQQDKFVFGHWQSCGPLQPCSSYSRKIRRIELWPFTDSKRWRTFLSSASNWFFCKVSVLRSLTLLLRLSQVMFIQSVPRSKHSPSQLYKPVS